MKPEALHAMIGIGLVCIAFGIFGGVAFLLYGSEFSLSFLPSSNTSQSRAQEYVCSDGLVVSITSHEDSTAVVFNEREEIVTHTPVPEGVEVPPDAWDRHVSSDGSFVLWERENTVLVQESGVVTHGECRKRQ